MIGKIWVMIKTEWNRLCDSIKSGVEDFKGKRYKSVLLNVWRSIYISLSIIVLLSVQPFLIVLKIFQKFIQLFLKAHNSVMQDAQNRTTRNSGKKSCCKKCGSEDIWTNTKGYGFIKGITGGLINPLGTLIGFAGKNKLLRTCLACGHKWEM